MNRSTAFIVIIPLILVVFLLLGMFFFSQGTGDGAVNQSTRDSPATILLSYGANEDNTPGSFNDNVTLQAWHRAVGSEYIRIWLSAPFYRPSSFPLNEDGSYDFSEIDASVNAVLNAGAVPFLVFAHYTVCGQGDDDAPPAFDFSCCEAHGAPPPEDDEAFGVYVGKVVTHLKEMCDAGRYYRPCSVNEWYVEVWNEPYGDAWWQGSPSRYAVLFNVTSRVIHSIAPGAQVGGYSGSYFNGNSFNARAEEFIRDTDADFISLHHYGNTAPASSDDERMANTKLLFYDAPIALRDYASEHGKPDIKIIMSEYNADFSAEYAPRLDEQFTAAWYAAALINEIKSQEVAMELFYAGTSNIADGGFGMWSSQGTQFPSFFMKQLFVQCNRPGSTVLDLSPGTESLETLAVENEQGRFITLVNKRNDEQQVTMVISEPFSAAIDLASGEEFRAENGTLRLTLGPYDVTFLKME